MVDKFKKQNALINAFTSNKITYKEVHHDLLNLFMGVIQKLYLKGKNFNSIVMTKEQICRSAKLDITSNIYPYLEDLAHIQYKLTNDDIKKINKNSNRNITKGFFNFIMSVKEEFHEGKKEKKYSIAFNPELFSFLLDNKYSVDHGNYTTVRIADITLLKSKYQKILGELILSKKYKKDFSFDYDFLREKLNIADKQSNYLIQLLKKHLPKLQKTFIEFNYEFHKKDKKISINIK